MNLSNAEGRLWVRVICGFAVFAAVTVVLGHILWDWAIGPTGVDESTLVIEKGFSGAEIAVILEEHGLIRHSLLFRIRLRMLELQSGIRAGEYRLGGELALDEIIYRLIQGVPEQGTRVMIPEGSRYSAIAGILDRAGVVCALEFMKVCANPSLLNRDIPELKNTDSLEGYLFPDTYSFLPDSSAAATAGAMVDNLFDRLPKNWRELCADKGMSLHELLTLASIVEMEAALDRERPLIAGVFLNRLNRGMKLESCATVQYALGHTKERLLYADLAVESEYNTYMHEGLPPGPIASPGISSIRAVLDPEETEKLFFVARGDGSHVFSRTLRAHQRAVREIRSNR